MANLLARKTFPKSNEIVKAFIDGPVRITALWEKYDCMDWRNKCVEKVRNMYKNKNKK
jgi:hypothetical protein